MSANENKTVYSVGALPILNVDIAEDGAIVGVSFDWSGSVGLNAIQPHYLNGGEVTDDDEAERACKLLSDRLDAVEVHKITEDAVRAALTGKTPEAGPRERRVCEWATMADGPIYCPE